jgi:hypothetical protein
MSRYALLVGTLAIVVGVLVVYLLFRRGAARFAAAPPRRGHRRRHPLPGRGSRER